MRISFIAAAAAGIIIAGLSQAEAETVPERLMADLQADYDFKEFQAAGIVGNLARETGNFRYMQEINPIVEGSRGGIGYSQWTASRRVNFESWVAEQGHDDMLSYEANYGFLKEELNSSYRRVVRKVKETETVEDASRVFMKYFLAPHPSYTHLDERIAYAEAYLEGDFSGAGCQAEHEIYNQKNMIILKMCPEQEQQVAEADDLKVSQAAIAEFHLGSGEVIAVSEEILRYEAFFDPAREVKSEQVSLSFVSSDRVEDPFRQHRDPEVTYGMRADL